MNFRVEKTYGKIDEKAYPSQVFRSSLENAKTLTEETAKSKFYSENTVTANTVLVIGDKESQPILKMVLQAALKANKNMKFIIIVGEHDYGTNKKEILKRLGREYGIPVKNIIPLINDRFKLKNAFAQDGFMAERDGIVESKHNTHDSSELADLLADKLQIKKRELSAIYRSGDAQFITMSNGKQMFYFGAETMNGAATGFSILNPIDSFRLKTIATIFEGIENEGVDLENIMPVGTGDRTYGQVLEEMQGSTEGRTMLESIPPRILARLRQMKDLTFPNQTIDRRSSFSYHTDLVINSLDGENFLLNEDDAREYPELRQTLNFFGKKTHTLPAIYKNEMAAAPPNNRMRRLTYMNWTMGRGQNGKNFILLPTETEDPGNLTQMDKLAVMQLRQIYPDAEIIPIGGKSAWLESDGRRSGRDWGPHCAAQMLPWQFDKKNQLVKLD